MLELARPISAKWPSMFVALPPSKVPSLVDLNRQTQLLSSKRYSNDDCCVDLHAQIIGSLLRRQLFVEFEIILSECWHRWVAAPSLPLHYKFSYLCRCQPTAFQTCDCHFQQLSLPSPVGTIETPPNFASLSFSHLPLFNFYPSLASIHLSLQSFASISGFRQSLASISCPISYFHPPLVFTRPLRPLIHLPPDPVMHPSKSRQSSSRSFLSRAQRALKHGTIRALQAKFNPLLPRSIFINLLDAVGSAIQSGITPRSSFAIEKDLPSIAFHSMPRLLEA